jgi:ATP-dependent DNA helicase RecQ
VRYVVHLDLPSNIESYYQETGRAGRDGLPATAFMLYGLQDVAMRRQMIENSDIPDDQKRIEHHKLTALLGYCEAAKCRREILLDYFGDTHSPCGNCDACTAPQDTIDGTIPAQKILSCIHRTGHIFGSKHIIDVLTGTPTAQVEKHGHTELSTWAIGTEYDRKSWESFIRQMVAANLIFVDLEGHGALKITQDGARFLKEKSTIEFRLPRALPRTARSDRTEKSTATITLAPDDQKLFESLKALRLNLARAHNLPPYIIFHDKTLMSMAQRRPIYRDSLAQIPGVGQSKLEKYGDAFIDVIRNAASVSIPA